GELSPLETAPRLPPKGSRGWWGYKRGGFAPDVAPLGQEATCPLCLDFFEQPMVLSCGHNFCRHCLAQLGPEASCPQCRAKVEPSSACPNWALANMVRLVKRLRPHLKKVFVLCPAVPVTLNGSTAHPQLIKYQECLDVPERFDQEFCVLGSEGFTTGWHCWEVSSRLPFVGGGKACWAVGVAKESIRRKGTFQLSSQEGIWAVGKSVRGEMVTFDMYHQKLSLQRPLQRLRVRLDCEVRNVEFLDAETEASLHISWVGSVRGETLRPFFYLGQEGVTLSM
uniref:Uncharacterized protein n=1 Tax=Naja naja TaxID=35670 RepID=A0A8C6VCC5_NAJNA